MAYGAGTTKTAGPGAKAARRGVRRLRYAYDRAVEPIVYGFPLGRVRVLEGRLLPLQRLERLVEARDFTEQRRILAETHYGELLADVVTAEQVEDSLEDALEEAYDFMEESRLPELVIEFFRIRYDFLNLRMLLKMRVADASKPRRWSVHGSVPPDVFEAASEAGDEDWLDELPPGLAATAAQVIELATGGEDSEGEAANAVEAAAIDLAFDKALYERIHQITAYEGSAWFARLGRIMVDMANARVAQRARRFGKDTEWIEAALIEGGDVPKEAIAAAETPAEAIMADIRAALMGISPDELERIARQLGSRQTMDIAADNVVLAMAKKGRMVAIGVEPIASYMLALENEIALLRVVLIGKLAGLPAPKIHERVRELYV
jgi:V/A-type H+-transporting ATPase subunit C